MTPEELFAMGQSAAKGVRGGEFCVDMEWAEIDPDMRDWLIVFAALIQERSRQAQREAFERAARHIAQYGNNTESPVIGACANLWSDEIRALMDEESTGD